MIYLFYLFCVALIHLSTAQVLTYNPRNDIENLVQGNQIQNEHNFNQLNPFQNANHHMTRNSQIRPNIQLSNDAVPGNYNPLFNGNIANINNAQTANLEFANAKTNEQIANAELAKAKYANAQMANAELANPKFANAQTANVKYTNAKAYAELANANLANTQVANEIANKNFANSQIANKFANSRSVNAQFANTEFTNNNYAQLANAEFNAKFYNTNARNLQPNTNNWENSIANNDFEIAVANLANNNPSSLWALNNMASIDGNTATFNFGKGGRIFTITSGSPNSPAFGIQLLADALEVGGTVAVNGQMPIYGTVTVNGNLPTDGSASVNYGSTRQA